MHRDSLQVLQSHISTNNEPIQLIFREKLAELLKALNLPSETVDQVSQAYFSSPQVSLLSILLSSLLESSSSSRDETNKKASVPSSNQEVGLETKLSLIEGKYEKILQQVTKLVN